jgi:uncharacterized peroxidase-related enzyme
MSYLTSLPDNTALLQVFRTYPESAKPLIAFHEVLMRQPSPFTDAERELIAAYVSGINACTYCHGVHTATAEAFGVEPGLLAAALSDVDTAPVADKLRPVLRYVGKLTVTPAKMTQADADEVFAAGWDDGALYSAVMVCALFNFMNRMVDGLGISAGPDYFAESGERLRRVGYAGLLPLIE